MEGEGHHLFERKVGPRAAALRSNSRCCVCKPMRVSVATAGTAR